MSAEYSKGKAVNIGTAPGPNGAKYEKMSNLEKLKTRLTKSPWRWIMLIGVIVIVIAAMAVPIVVTVQRNGDKTGTTLIQVTIFILLYTL